MKALWLALVLSGCGCSTLPTHDEVRATTLRLEFGEKTLCSGTAIGPDLVLTAEHCLDAPLTLVNGTLVASEVVARDAKRDTATLRITGLRFERWARFGPLPKQGARVRWFGHAGGVVDDLYREGYVSHVGDGYLVIVGNICKGDSGSAAFADDGRIVAVVSAMSDANGCTFMKAGAL